MKLVIGICCILSGVVAFTALRPGNSEEVLNEHPNAATSSYRTVPVLVELFTSEGCSSCPPADALLSKLVKAETIPGVEVIALGEHVDYWNNLGWNDQYSKADFSQRQRDYSAAFDLDSVYTPQMIVDGQEEFVGGDWNRARAAIVKAAQTPKGRIDLTLIHKADVDQNSPVRRLAIQVKDLPSRSDDADVLFAITENNLQTQVSRGENRGRYLHHSAVVRELNVAGHIVANDDTFVIERSINISPGWRTENLRVIAFVQERRSHRILAVGELPWK
ncbi:MAG TPA: DUF1223 domain-containing protein [Pyrinomonadaceae bacterium]|nr:DUF1223 domain-containing protein [Pyrinomonadaceae bacterium]